MMASFKFMFLALLAKGQRSLWDGASSVARPSVRPSSVVCPLATSPQKPLCRLQPNFHRRFLPSVRRKCKCFFSVARPILPPLLKIAKTKTVFYVTSGPIWMKSHRYVEHISLNKIFVFRGYRFSNMAATGSRYFT